MTEQIFNQTRFLLEAYYDSQHLRIETFNRIVAYVKSHPEIIKDLEPADTIPASLPIEQDEEETMDKPSIMARKIVALKVQVPKDIDELVWYHNSMLETEDKIAKYLAAWSKHHKLRLNYLNKIKGIGPILSSGLIAWLSPIERFGNISKLWSYCGLSAIHYKGQCKEKHRFISTHPYSTCPVKVGKTRELCNAAVIKCEKVDAPPKRTAGYVLMCNLRMRTLLWKIATSFEKQNAKGSRYRRMYEERKAMYLVKLQMKNPDEKGIKGHARNMTLRYVAKQFLADLWIEWRQLEGLSVSKPYAIAILEHSGYQEPKTDS